MVPAAVLDANVLFPMILRDTLLRVAAAGCYRAHWSERILDEMARNLVAQHRVTTVQADRLATEMRRAFPDATVEGWEALEAEMPNDPKDRHVAAAAKHIKAAVIVTANLKDFALLPAGLRAISPDAFLRECLAAEPATVLAALRKQAAGYRHPPADLDTLLAWLEGDLPDFVQVVRRAIISAGKA
jgi:predicted nucleic acid-binding protein